LLTKLPMESLRRRYFGKSVATEDLDTAKKKSKIIGCREKGRKPQGRYILETRLYREDVMGWYRSVGSLKCDASFPNDPLTTFFAKEPSNTYFGAP